MGESDSTEGVDIRAEVGNLGEEDIRVEEGNMGEEDSTEGVMVIFLSV